MLEHDDEGKVKSARGTTRVKGKSYRHGEVYISSIHVELGQMEVCCYDARHHITNSSTRYHCGDCCARISKGSNSIENSEGDPNHCWWREMEVDCPAWHTHLHNCDDYETKEPKAPRERLRRDLGLDNTGRTSGTTTSTAAISTNYTSSNNTNPTREDADSEPTSVKIQPPATPPGVPDPNLYHPTNTTNQAAETAKKQLIGVQLPNQGGYAVTHPDKLLSLRKMIAQLNTHDVDELGFTFFRETQQTSQFIYGFEVFADYRVALATQNRTAIHTVDENGNHLTKYCAKCHTWLPIDLEADDTPPCAVCAIQSTLLAAANENVSSPANNETERTRTQPHNPSTTTTHTAASIPAAPTAAFIPAAPTAAFIPAALTTASFPREKGGKVEQNEYPQHQADSEANQRNHRHAYHKRRHRGIRICLHSHEII
jgi:hypothetical protein